MRNLTNAEILTLTQQGNSAADWQQVFVCDGFSADAIRNSRFEGRVELEEDVVVVESTICNYHLCRGSKVLSTTRLECRNRSSFGNGVRVAAVNENGGREVAIYNELTAQIAYIVAMYRHRKSLVEAITAEIDAFAEGVCSDMGVVGQGSTIIGAKFIREVNIGKGVTIEGASLVENATLLDGAYVGIDVKASDFIAAEGSKVDCGAIVKRVFVGENCVVSNGFTAVDTLLFAASHLENGESCSVFAGPYTVSHHKSTLLIAGIFSFFNAGSGTNQSNHLFKSGAIHQAVHRRGCKFASNGYVMAPAAEGEFTTLLGRHTKHHDTSAFPFSYLIESNGVSYLLPAFALRSYGTVRDIEKWQQRDRRVVKRDIVNYEGYNPLLAGKAYRAIEILQRLLAENPDAEELSYCGTTIKRRMATLGISLYENYLTAALGYMLERGCGSAAKGGFWVDVAGQYIDKELLDNLLDNFTSIKSLNVSLLDFAADYDDKAHCWALSLLDEGADIGATIAAGREAHCHLRQQTEADRAADVSCKMSVGYGIDSVDEGDIMADFNSVHAL